MNHYLIHCFAPASYKDVKSLPAGTSTVINSNISQNGRELLNARSIKYYAWESDFIAAIHQGYITSIADYATVDIIKNFEPLDMEFLSEMYKRTIYADSMSISASLSWYCNYFVDIIERHSIKIVICKAVPHSFGDYALVAVSKVLGIRVIGCLPFFGWSTRLFAAYSFNRNHYVPLTKASGSGLTTDSQAVKDTIKQALASSCGKSLYPYDENLNNIIGDGRSAFVREALAMLKTPRPEPYLPILNKIAHIKRIIDDNQVNRLPNKYATLFLSYEPEASLTPMGGNYWNQRMYAKVCSTICEQLRIPLIIREHPDFTRFPFEKAQDIAHYFLSPGKFSRSKEFYNYLLDLPQIIGFDGSRLADQLGSSSLQIVFTISGSISLEAFLAKKVVVVGGPSPLHLKGSSVISLSDMSREKGLDIHVVVSQLQKLIHTASTCQIKAVLVNCIEEYAITPDSIASEILIGQFL